MPTTSAGIDAPAGRQTSLRDLVAILFRRRWIVLGVAMPFIGFAIYGTMTSTDVYSASAQVLIDARTVENPSFRQTPIDVDVLMNTAAQVAQSIPVAKRAAASLVDSLPGLRQEDQALSDLQTEGDLRRLILTRINCGQVGESNILSVGFAHGNPRLAKLVVGAVSNAFIAHTVEQGRNSEAVDYYSEQIASAHGEIDSLMTARLHVFEEAGLSGFQVNNTAGIQQMRHMEFTYYETRGNREALESKYSGVLQAIRNNPDYLPAQRSGENPILVGSKAELDKALLDLSQLRVVHTESSLFVVRQREYVDQARTFFEQERSNYLSDLENELDGIRRKEKLQYEALNTYREGVLDYPKWERMLYALDMRVNTKRDLLESLQLKLGEVRLKAEGDERISNITLLNAPSISVGVAGSKKFVYLVLTILLGVVLAAVTALLLDAQDHRIYDRRQAQEVLDVPVLGAISGTKQPVSRT